VTRPTKDDADGRIARLGFGPGSSVATLRDTMQALLDEDRAYVVVLEVLPSDAGFSEGDLAWLEWFTLPVVAWFEEALRGASAGVALACDVRFCGAGASVLVSAESDERLRRLLHDEQALRRATAEEPFDAAQMLECGLVSKVTAEGGAEAEALRLAATMASRGPIALRLGKEAIWRGLEMALEQALRFETDLTLLLQTTKDRAEGVRAFLEKREPRFTGD
jgi:enoyl-CoA hydratase/carnithine racemase